MSDVQKCGCDCHDGTHTCPKCLHRMNHVEIAHAERVLAQAHEEIERLRAELKNAGKTNNELGRWASQVHAALDDVPLPPEPDEAPACIVQLRAALREIAERSTHANVTKKRLGELAAAALAPDTPRSS